MGRQIMHETGIVSNWDYTCSS